MSALPRIGAAAPRQSLPQVGQTIEGHTFMGGNAGDPRAWKAETGDKFLNSMPLDDSIKAVVKSIANYELPPGSGRGGIGSPEVQQILGLAKQYDPTFDAKNYQAVQKARTEMGNPDSQFNKTVTALNTAIDHIAGLAGSAQALDNSSLPAENWMVNKYRDWTGDARPVQFNQNATIGADEIVKAIAGGNGGGEGDRRNMEGMFNVNGSPAQQQGAISKAVQLLGSKLDELNETYGRAASSHGDVTSLLSPSARQSWTALHQQYGINAGQPSAIANAGPRGRAVQPQQGGGQAPGAASVPPGAIQLLRANPQLAPHFDAKYGAGASGMVLGR